MTATTKTAKGFDGLTVAAFESRMADEMAHLIAHHGGRPLLAPSMREIPLDQNHEALAFGERLLRGEIDVLILLTGVGARTLVQILETRQPKEKVFEALARVVRVCRGPKPVAALRALGVDPGISVPEPNTWQELLSTLDEAAPVRGRRVAVQEYGISNLELLQGLRERGAEVIRVPVYRWALPTDLEPLRQALRRIAAGEVQVALFTNANQVENVMQVARDEGLLEKVRAGLARAVVASVGPISTESLKDHGISADLEPSHPKMGPLVREASLACHEILETKRSRVATGGETSTAGDGAATRASVTARAGGGPEAGGGAEPGGAPEPGARAAGTRAARGGPGDRLGRDRGVQPGRDRADRTGRDPLAMSPFMRACRREPAATPVWLMRQAGRFMREYRQIRARRSFLEFCKDPDLVAQVTVYAVERLKVDAAIIFADLLLPVEAMGLGLSYGKGEGPVIDPVVATREDIDRLRDPDVEETLGYVFEAIRRTRRALPSGVPLIGFAGAPFTVASYMIEGGGSKNYVLTKSLFYGDPGAWHALLERISKVTIAYLNGQIAAGAQVVQLFDSWVGCLSPGDYREFVLPHTRKVIASITSGVPVIHFGTDTASLLPSIREAGGQVIGLDWRVDLVESWDRLGDVAVMGNLDPTVLFAPRDEVRRRVRALLEKVGRRPGHIFNLGHGILPRTPVDSVLALVDAVHEWGGA